MVNNRSSHKKIHNYQCGMILAGKKTMLDVGPNKNQLELAKSNVVKIGVLVALTVIV